jgi:hypothetical protein
VEAARHLLAHVRNLSLLLEFIFKLAAQVDEVSKSHEKLMEATRQYCSDSVLVEQKCAAIPLLSAFSGYCQRSIATYKGYGDCISVNTVDQLRTTRKATKAVRFCAKSARGDLPFRS